MAAASGDEEAVMSCLVVDTGLALEKDQNGDSALFVAVSNGHEGVVRILLDTGLQVETEVETECLANDPRPTALWLAQVFERHDIAKLLINRGATIDLRNGTRPQVLIQAAKEENVELVRRCLEVGVAINVAGPTGETALGWAVDNRDEEMTKLLILNGAIAHHTLLLDAAAKGGHAGLFGVLLENTNEPQGDTFRKILLDPESQHEDILQLVVRKWMKVDKNCRLDWERVLADAAEKGYEAAVRVLLDNGTRNQDALVTAAAGGHVEILRLLLEQSAEIDGYCSSSTNALHQAALGGYSEAVRLLLDRGVKIDAVDSRGWNALHYATIIGDVEIVRLLLARGAKINAVDRSDHNALHCAAKHGNVKGHSLDIARMLLEQGADRQARTKKGQTPLQLVSRWNFNLKLLLGETGG